MITLSVVINTLNEEENLLNAIKSVKNLSDEIIVVDMMSDDKTQEIAKKLGAKVYEHEKMGYVEPARNFAISKATGDWILILDADERITPELHTKIKQIINSENPQDYYRIPRKNLVFGKWLRHSRWWPDYNIRLFKKGYVEWNEVIHSVPMTRGDGADLEAIDENAIVHYHYVSIDQYVERMNRYTTHQAIALAQNKYNFNWKDIITKPTNEFLSRYFEGEGYKDGVHGLALSGLQAFSELVVYLKVWQMNNFKKQQLVIEDVIEVSQQAGSDIRYWQSDTLIKERGGIKYHIKRKLRI